MRPVIVVQQSGIFNMKTIEFINKHGIHKLTERFGIKVSHNERYPDLFCLNYSQIDSHDHKFHDIVKECRSLVVRESAGKFVVESRSFDRFFNYGENPENTHNIHDLVACEKVDGSLVSVWKSEKYGWLYRTKSMVMPAENMNINGWELTWKELIESTIPFDLLEKEIVSQHGSEDFTFIFEVVSRENRVVTRYDEKCAYFLHARNKDGYYTLCPEDIAESLGVSYPKEYRFDSFSDCLEVVKYLPNLQEGYVLKDKASGTPVLKIKSPAYLAGHRLRGESRPTPKRIMDMIFINEQDEYLSIFPEDAGLFDPYITAFDKVQADFDNSIVEFINIVDQKDFALKVKDKSVASMLFTKRKNTELQFRDIFDTMFTSTKYKIVENYL